MRMPIAVLLALATLSFSTLSAGQSTEPETGRIGTFKQIQGEAWLGEAHARRHAVSGEGVKANDQLTTGETGAAIVTLKDGTVLTMGPNSSMTLEHFEYNTTTQEGSFLLDLLKGSVRVVTGLIAKTHPDNVKIKTPTSVVGVRGTDFIVQTEATR